MSFDVRVHDLSSGYQYSFRITVPADSSYVFGRGRVVRYRNRCCRVASHQAFPRGSAKKVLIAIHTDSSAGKSMASRFGTSKRTRHVKLRFLFVQYLILQQVINLRKIEGVRNTADVLTKYVKADVLHKHLHHTRKVPSTTHFVFGAIFHMFEKNMQNSEIDFSRVPNNMLVKYMWHTLLNIHASHLVGFSDERRLSET